MTELNIQFVGTGGTAPTSHRGLPATLVARDGVRVLVDCGEGTQRQLMRQGALKQFYAIALTHLHADHWLGLAGLLKTWDMQDREADLRIYAPRERERDIRLMLDIVGWPKYYKVHMLPVDDGDDTYLADGWRMRVFKTDHSVTSVGYTFDEDMRPGRFDPEAARKLGVTDPRDFGKLSNGHSVHTDGDPGMVVTTDIVVGPLRPGRRVVVSGDTRPCSATAYEAEEADLLIHDAAFLIEDQARANKTKHSTVAEAVKQAHDSNAKRLALVHTGAKYSASAIIAEAQDSIDTSNIEVFMPRDADTVNIPLKD